MFVNSFDERGNLLVSIPKELHTFIESLVANIFIADKEFNIIFMNTCARNSLKRLEVSLWDAFKVNVDEIIGKSIHRFHQNPEKVGEAFLFDFSCCT